jgi:hypothetical protein
MKKFLFVLATFFCAVPFANAADLEFLGAPHHWYLPFRTLFDHLMRGGLSSEYLFWFVLLILSLMIVLLANQLVGLKFFNMYLLIMWIFFASILGLPLFLISLFVFILFSAGLNIVFVRFKFLYFSRISAHLAVGIFCVLLILLVAMQFKINIDAVTILGLIVLLFFTQHSTVKDADRLGSVWFALVLKSLAMTLFVYFFVNWSVIKNLFLSYPDLLLLSIPILLWLGRRTGLRLMELGRFSRLIRKEMDEDYKDLIS